MKNLRVRIIMILFAMGSILWSCESLIYDDLEDCPQGVYIKFYSQTPCADDSLYIAEVSSLTVFAFNKDGILETSIVKPNVNLAQDFEVLIPVSNGNYSFIAWAGINDKFTQNTFTKGVTTKKDLLLTINSANNQTSRLQKAEQIWHGESGMVFLPDPKEYGSLYEHISMNMQELTNRVKVIVEFDKETMKDYNPENVNIAISSANGSVRVDGTMPMNSPILTYPPFDTKIEQYSGEWNYSLLALTTGYSNKLKVTYNKDGKEEVIFNGDLIASILLKAIDKGVSLDCENDFTIKFLVKDYCADCGTHFSCGVYVNDWLVHSYSSNFEI